MNFKRFGERFVIRIDKEEKIVETLTKICVENNITLGIISGIGAVCGARIGMFKPKEKKYVTTELLGDYEITSLNGNISIMNGEVYLHLHINLADEKQKTFGGHLNEAVVSATCEVVIEKVEGSIEREYDNETGLNLLKI
ncbi:MAG: DNA-binding protein [Armatimonadetes bacterium]|nr:DNA-binding protein [Armatimonadota bacterium]